MSKPEPSSQYLLGEVAEKWLMNVRNRCKLSTFDKYYTSYNRHVKNALGEFPMAKINNDLIEEFVERLSQKEWGGKTLSRKTMQDICMVVKQIYSYAEDNYGITAGFSYKKLRIKQVQHEAVALTSAEIEKLGKYLVKKPDKYRVGVILAMSTGMRIGELCALKWEDISLTEGTVHVSKTAQRLQTHNPNDPKKTVVLVTEPKSEKSNRIIPLSSTLMKLLAPMQKDADLFFLSEKTTCCCPQTIRTHFKKYIHACGIRDVTFHTLRHTFATQCVQSGVDVKTLSELLGHSSVNITLNRYVHSSLEMKKEAVNRLTVYNFKPSNF